ncbi:hypothetical protein ABZS66_33255 [Dactylosporangium sp. NPDC005572]|uniref:hypothetical protein n=1 Tax=Dactylosporangium sp. NPDC005572 TaxID=3156889 RepID=UPI0033A0A30C
MNSRARGADSSVRWVPIAGLTELARALLGERRGDRDVIPARVGDRVTALAKQWAAHGFTPETVHPWMDLEPAAAALLAARGISPASLQQHIVATQAGNTSLWRAVASGALSAADAVNQLDAASPPVPTAVAPAPSPVVPVVSAMAPAPAVFSHPVAAPDPDNTDRRRRSMPAQTPFRA